MDARLQDERIQKVHPDGALTTGRLARGSGLARLHDEKVTEIHFGGALTASVRRRIGHEKVKKS